MKTKTRFEIMNAIETIYPSLSCIAIDGYKGFFYIDKEKLLNIAKELKVKV